MAAESDLMWNPRDELLRILVASVKPTLRSQDRRTGRFGTPPWICNDQNVLLALAAAWAIKDRANPWYHKRELLDAIMAGGDALVDDQDCDGRWTFRKKDGSTWGQIAQPWTYTRWVRAFALVKDAMPKARRAKWEEGLLLGYNTISTRALRRVHNIACHLAMGLYCAGEVFGRDDWKRQAAQFTRKVVSTQRGNGYWSEHQGPVVLYNFVYVEAIGCYHAMSGDKSVLPALRRAAEFHARMVYPDGTMVETVDERNPYRAGAISPGSVGFSFTPRGRGFLLHQLACLKKAGRSPGADFAAQMLLYGETGPAEPIGGDDESQWTSTDGKMGVLRSKPWLVVGSAYTAAVPDSRWIQDRQNFVSVFHDRVGLVVGGGNTKLQPYWSAFTVGDRSLMQHRRGDASPDFTPPAGLVHVPRSGSLRLLKEAGAVRVVLNYGAEQGTVEVVSDGDDRVRIIFSCVRKGTLPVHGHLTLIPHVGRVIRNGSGASQRLSGKPIEWTTRAAGGWIEHAGWRLALPPGARLVWPKKAHNPYRKTGHSSLGEARLVVEMPFDARHAKYEFVLSVSGMKK